MSSVATLLAEIEAFLKDAEIAETTFGLRALRDGKFVGRLRRGGGVTVRNADRVRAYIAEQRQRLSAPKRRRAA